MKVLELFSGTKCLSNAFRAKGHECFTIDYDKRFSSSMHIDIEHLTADMIFESFGKPDIIWVGTPCETYSIAAISHHRRLVNGVLEPVSDKAIKCDRMNIHVKKLIEELKPKYYFWENPRGALRKMPFMQDMPRYTVCYCKYQTDLPESERRMKPTDI